MKADVKWECVLGFAEDKWTLRCPLWTLEDPDWETLKEKLRVKTAEALPGTKVIIDYYFDMHAFPRRFHQYQNHYFNGTFIIKT